MGDPRTTRPQNDTQNDTKTLQSAPSEDGHWHHDHSGWVARWKQSGEAGRKKKEVQNEEMRHPRLT